MNEFIVIFGAGISAAAITFVLNWLGLMAWKANRDKHWSEQARLLFPVLGAASLNYWYIPIILALGISLFWSASIPVCFFAGLAGIVGTHIGMLPLACDLPSHMPFRRILRFTLFNLLIQVASACVFFGAVLAMPDEFNTSAFLIGGTVVGLKAILVFGGYFFVRRKLGYIVEAPTRLQKIARETSDRIRIPFREVLMLRSNQAQAWAYIGTGRMVFTERLIEILSDEEIAVICAHELAHLGESKRVVFLRYLAAFTFMPWVFFKPVNHSFGFVGIYFLLIVIPLMLHLVQKISRRMEVRADQTAKTSELDEGTYARALLRLYEDNLIPAVMEEKGAHPDLYDRMLAAGVTPDFPRPRPAHRMTLYGHVLRTVAVILFIIFALKLANVFPPSPVQPVPPAPIPYLYQ